MSGKLYLVGTPIGNLGDITYRAVETLKSVDIIACEDTRHTLHLLNFLQIKKPLISYYKQKENEGSEEIIRLLEEGKDVALVSDAGMPCISDPGAVLSRKARETGITVTTVPGPTALCSAVALCGLEGGFTFVGFLPDKSKDAEEVLSSYSSCETPLIFYVAPHDVNRTLKQLFSFFGDRPFFAVKELTKIYETVYSGTLATGEIEEPRGEFVLIVLPEKKTVSEVTDERILLDLKAETEKGVDKKTAVKNIVFKYKISKNRVYKLSLQL